LAQRLRIGVKDCPLLWKLGPMGKKMALGVKAAPKWEWKLPPRGESCSQGVKVAPKGWKLPHRGESCP
jgi:hypothetical protein